MKTLELIKIRNECYNGADCENDFDCPFNYLNECREALAKRLADRLEKAYNDLGKSECVTCKWAEECNQHDCIYDRNLRAEAIKEFAERLSNYKEYRYNENCDFVPYVRLSDIEKVEKEMVGAENEN